MSINSRNKGAAFERQIANALIDDLNLKNPVKRILEQTRTKELPILHLEDGVLNAKPMEPVQSLDLIGGSKFLHLQAQRDQCQRLYTNLITDQ